MLEIMRILQYTEINENITEIRNNYFSPGVKQIQKSRKSWKSTSHRNRGDHISPANHRNLEDLGNHKNKYQKC
jgi:hypothetical protein